MMRLIIIFCTTIILCSNLHAQEIDQIQQLFAVGDTFNPANNQLGNSVAIDGEWAVVGSILKASGDNQSSTGGVNIYRKVGGTWSLFKELYDPNLTVSLGFGRAVDISGNLIVVGTNNGGEVYAYHKDEGGTNNWGLINDEIRPLDWVASDGFGRVLALHDSILTVSSTSKDSGRVYIFHINPNTYN